MRIVDFRHLHSLALPATSALCIASHRKEMSHSRSDADVASVLAVQVLQIEKQVQKSAIQNRECHA